MVFAPSEVQGRTAAMLVMNHPVFRRFWYPVIPIEHLKAGPQRFELLGQALALFLDDQGAPAALEDRAATARRACLSARPAPD